MRLSATRFSDGTVTAVDDRVVVFEVRPTCVQDAPLHALAVVAGLPVLVRNLLLVEALGFRRALLLVDPGGRPAVADALARRPDLAIDVALMSDRTATLAVVASAIESPSAVLYWPGELSCGLVAPAIATRAVAPGTVIVEAGGPIGSSARLLLFDGGRLAASAHLTATQLVDELGRQGRATYMPPSTPMLTVRSPADAAKAGSSLLQSLRKPVDGKFARYNRCVSLAVTSRLLPTAVTPNQATLVAGLVGVASGPIAGHGGYGWLLIGALCYQASNVLDGVDGEIARAKLLASPFGQWFDTLADDATNLSFCVGTAFGAYRTWHAGIYLALGGLAGGELLAIAAVMYHYLITVARSGDLNAFKWPWERATGIGAASPFLGRMKHLLKRDAFAYMAVVAAAVGQARATVWLAALGSTGLLFAWAAHTALRRVAWRRI